MFVMQKCLSYMLRMQMIWRINCYDINLGIVKHFLVIRSVIKHFKFITSLAARFKINIADHFQIKFLTLQSGRNSAASFAQAEDADVQQARGGTPDP